MLDKTFFKKLKKQHDEHARGRREIIALAGEALSASKRAIFALHRDDVKGAATLLASAEERFGSVRALFKSRPELIHEGSYRAALEEYVEARLYEQYLSKGIVGILDFPDIDYDTYLGGLADMTGELVRREVLVATAGNLDEVRKLKEAVEAVVAELLEMDLGGYLRTKFDQAKNNLRRAEDVLYEVTIRRT